MWLTQFMWLRICMPEFILKKWKQSSFTTSWRYGQTYSLCTIKCCKKSELRESYASLIHMGVFSSSFDTMLLLSLHTKFFRFSSSFLPDLRTWLSLNPEEDPRLMQTWKMSHAKAFPEQILQNVCVFSDLPGLTGLQSVCLLAVPRSSLWNT